MCRTIVIKTTEETRTKCHDPQTNVNYPDHEEWIGRADRRGTCVRCGAKLRGPGGAWDDPANYVPPVRAEHPQHAAHMAEGETLQAEMRRLRDRLDALPEDGPINGHCPIREERHRLEDEIRALSDRAEAAYDAADYYA